MQIKANSSKPAILQLKDTLETNIGFEKTLSQAIRFLISGLAAYISFIDQMSSSIDRIIEKSRFVVGEIDFSGIYEETGEETL